MQDIEFITALKSGNESAFRWLVETYQDRIYRLVLVLVPQPDEAEDVTQEVFIEVYETIHQFRGEASLFTWLYRLATSRALAHHRHRKAKKRFAFLTSLFGEDDELVHQPVTVDHPGRILENEERRQLLINAIGRLADQQKVAFTLHYLEGIDYHSIASVMQTSVSAVESLLHRAKQNLRKYLGTYYNDTKHQ